MQTGTTRVPVGGRFQREPAHLRVSGPSDDQAAAASAEVSNTLLMGGRFMIMG